MRIILLGSKFYVTLTKGLYFLIFRILKIFFRQTFRHFFRRLSFKEFCTLIALPSPAQPQGLALAPAKDIIITPELFRALRDLARDSLNMMSEDGAA